MEESSLCNLIGRLHPEAKSHNVPCGLLEGDMPLRPTKPSDAANVEE